MTYWQDITSKWQKKIDDAGEQVELGRQWFNRSFSQEAPSLENFRQQYYTQTGKRLMTTREQGLASNEQLAANNQLMREISNAYQKQYGTGQLLKEGAARFAELGTKTGLEYVMPFVPGEVSAKVIRGEPTSGLERGSEVLALAPFGFFGKLGGKGAKVVEKIIPKVAPEVEKLTKLIKAAKPVRELAETAKSEKLSEKFGAVGETLSGGGGREAYQKARAQLEGKNLPDINFDPPEVNMLGEEIDNLFNKIGLSELTPATKFNISTALNKVLKGELPTVGEIARLEKFFGKDLGSALSKKFKPKLMDYATELYYNSILSGPKTHIINTSSNLFNALMSPVERLVTAMVDPARVLIRGGHRERFFGEVAADVFGLLRGIPEGIRAATTVLKREQSLEAASKYFEMGRTRAFKGVAGRLINIPSDVLEAADALFYGINKTAAVRAEAYRVARKAGLKGDELAIEINKLINNPTEELLENAHKIAEYRLFRQEAGAVTQGLMNLRDREFWGIKPLRFVIPFLRTPINLVKYGLERSPLGILNPKLWENIFKNNPQASEQIARWLIGSSVSAAIAAYVADDKITAAVPKTPAERDRFYREGKQPYSIKIGNKWVSYQRFEPFNQPINQVASVIEAINNKKPEDTIYDLAGEIAMTIGKNFASQTYMQSIGDLINGIEDPERYGKQFIQNLITGFIPYSASLRTAEQMISPEIEEPQNVIEKIKASIPGLSESVPKKMTAFGEPSTRLSPAWSPISVSPATNDALEKELERLEFNVGLVGSTIGERKLTDEEKRQYQQLAGQITKQNMINLIQSEGYNDLTDEGKKKALQRISDNAKEQARNQIKLSLSGVTSEVGDYSDADDYIRRLEEKIKQKKK